MIKILASPPQEEERYREATKLLYPLHKDKSVPWSLHSALSASRHRVQCSDRQRCAVTPCKPSCAGFSAFLLNADGTIPGVQEGGDAQGSEGCKLQMSLTVRGAKHHLSQDGPSSLVGAACSASYRAHTCRLFPTIFWTFLI